MIDLNLKGIPTIEFCWHYASISCIKQLPSTLCCITKIAALDFNQNIIKNDTPSAESVRQGSRCHLNKNLLVKN